PLIIQGLVSQEPFPLLPIPAPTCTDTSESYYEEAQPYEETFNDDGEAVSSSYESYDEEDVSRGKSPSAQHQWPSAEASIELMKDSRICAFLWRKKWLGQWAKQLCVIKDHRLLCYKSSKEQTPLLDVSLLGCSVVYKEKQLKRKEHKLKIIPVGGEAIVLALQSKEQTEQWLKVIHLNRSFESLTPTLWRFVSGGIHPKYWFLHTLMLCSSCLCPSTVKKKYGAGLMFSNLMNIGKKKPSSLESPEKCVDTSGCLNVLVNSQWRTCWCLIKNGQLWFYQDKGKNKVSQPAVTLEGCSISPDPSPEHLYSFRIDMDGTQLATLEAKTSADMGHWLGLLLSQTGTKTDPDELTYDYVNAERISTIVSAAKTLMQRRYSEPNTYINNSSSIALSSEELYDDVASIADPEVGTGLSVRLSRNTRSNLNKADYLGNHTEEQCLTLPSTNAVEGKLGKNRTEADMRRYIDERDRLEKEREEVRSSLANLKKERKEVKEELGAYPKQQASLEARLKQKEEACRDAERHRVEVELQLVEVRGSLKKVESGPFTLGTTLDSSLQDLPTVSGQISWNMLSVRTAVLRSSTISLQQKAATMAAPQTSSSSLSSSSSSQPSSNNASADTASPVNSASALKARPTSIMATKGKVLQKAKVRHFQEALILFYKLHTVIIARFNPVLYQQEWEKKSTT
uniref:Actin filament-associated protein 1-like 2 n=1 Tax=Mola mola TaxID=94237 RepID=A0A3Q3X0N3_MOLML